MASRKTWIWAIVAVLGALLVVLIAAAGTGLYFVSRHIATEHTTSADALRSFDAVTASLPNPQPIFELGDDERPRAVRPLSELPTSPTRPETLRLLAWDPDGERLIRASLPLWMIRFGRGRMRVGKDRRPLDLDRLELDSEELQRIGPALLFDVRDHDGSRLLLWTD
ncbi:MAG: hypothetical protein IT184_04630 [Acidobacteria bacterium]|nr:hypothetical protein [Acidobacteriota bacterium]